MGVVATDLGLTQALSYSKRKKRREGGPDIESYYATGGRLTWELTLSGVGRGGAGAKIRSHPVRDAFYSLWTTIWSRQSESARLPSRGALASDRLRRAALNTWSWSRVKRSRAIELQPRCCRLGCCLPHPPLPQLSRCFSCSFPLMVTHHASRSNPRLSRSHPVYGAARVRCHRCLRQRPPLQLLHPLHPDPRHRHRCLLLRRQYHNFVLLPRRSRLPHLLLRRHPLHLRRCRRFPRLGSTIRIQTAGGEGTARRKWILHREVR